VRGEPVSADERESQLSAMFDGELPETECELLARRLSRDAAMKQQWARYSLIGAVIRDEPLRARRDSAGRMVAGIAARLAVAIEAEQAPAQSAAAEDESATARPAAGGARLRWARPAAGFAVAAGVAALSVFWLQGRTPVAAPQLSADVGSEPAALRGMGGPAGSGSVRSVSAGEIIAPGVVSRGAGAEVVLAAANDYASLPAGRGVGSGEPESYVVPMPAGRSAGGLPAQLANYVVAHSEFSAPLSRRSLLSALVASEAAAVPAPAATSVDTPPPAGAVVDGTRSGQ